MAWVVLFHTLIFLGFWLTNLSFQRDVNDFLSDTTGIQLNFLLIFLLFSLVVFLWSTVRLALQKQAGRAGPAWLYNAVGAFYLLFFYGSFTILFIKNPVQVARLGELLQYFRIFFDAILLLLAVWGVRLWLKKIYPRWQKVLAVGGLFLLWGIPLLWTPGNVYRGNLPEKPLLIAHRGASSLAPENTLAAMRIAAEMGVYGLETDIDISRDGVLFLMHDPTLKRTTNVAEVFPGRENDAADSFTWNELAQLDAGSWFVGQNDYSGEPIPSLPALLQVVHDRSVHFIYDLRIPPADHPYAAQTLYLCLGEIKAAGVASRTWVLAGRNEAANIHSILPEAMLAAGIDYGQRLPTPASLTALGYRLVNSEYGLPNSAIRTYQKAGLWVNLWTVDESWQYSRLWLAGADSVTSNNIQTLITMSRPVMAMAYPVYLIAWGAVGILAIGVCFQKGKTKEITNDPDYH